MKRLTKGLAAALAVGILALAVWYFRSWTLEEFAGVSLDSCQQIEVSYWRDMSPCTEAETVTLTPEDTAFSLLLSVFREQTFSRSRYSPHANSVLPEMAFRWLLVFSFEDGIYVTVDEGYNQPELHRGSRHWRVSAAEQSRWRTDVRDIILGEWGRQPP